MGDVKDVIVVGAGVSGLAAAQTAQRAGLTVAVVEARDRIGGRLYSLNCGSLTNIIENESNAISMGSNADIYVEAGANWVHNMSKSNVIYRIATKLGLQMCQMYSSEVEIDPLTIIADRSIDGDHRLFSADEIRQAALCYEELMEETWKVYRKLRKGRASTRNTISLAEGLERGMRRLESKRFISESVRQLVAWRVEMECLSNAEDVDGLSLCAWISGEEEDLHGEGLVSGGLSQILPELSEGLHITLQCPVTDIYWDNRHSPPSPSCPMRVVTGQGDFLAWNVIVTAPLGCIQARSILFHPPLPTATQAAIDSLHVGLLAVVVLRFEHVFWPQGGAGAFGVPPSAGNTWRDTPHQEGCERYPDDDLFYSFVPLSDTRPDRCPLLLGYVAGRRARQLESMSDWEVASCAHLSLRLIFGEGVALPPIGVAFHRWGADPYSRGSYSTLCVGTTREAKAVMAAPMYASAACVSGGEGRDGSDKGGDGVDDGVGSGGVRTPCPFSACSLQLAGEATEFDLVGLLQGAHASGVRAAKNIIKNIIKNTK